MLTATKGRYSNTITMTYDDGGRLATEALTVGGVTYPVGYTYTDSGQRDTMALPRGSVVDFDYTSRDQYASVSFDSDGAGGQAALTVASYVYDNGGRETSRTFGNSLVTTTSYASGENRSCPFQRRLLAGGLIRRLSGVGPAFPTGMRWVDRGRFGGAGGGRGSLRFATTFGSPTAHLPA